MNNKITNYKQIGIPRTERVHIDKYEQLSKRFKDEFNVDLPDVNKLSRHNMNTEELRILCNHIFISFSYKGEYYSLEFKPGFIWDLMSVPKMFRSIISNDNIRGIVAGMVHDFAYNTHKIDRVTSNKLFYWLLRLNGSGRIPSILYYSGVAVGGKAIYESKDIESSWMVDCVDFVIKQV
jgi:hypothetical protein